MSACHRFVVAILTAAVLTFASPALVWAAPSWTDGAQLALLGMSAKQPQASSAAEAARIAKQRYGGKILKVDAVRTGDGVQYRVKILLDNGRVKTVIISG